MSIPDVGKMSLSGCLDLTNSVNCLRSHQSRSSGDRLRQSTSIASAIKLTNWAMRNTTEHFHGHSCADTAQEIALAQWLGGPNYSVILHGDLDVFGCDHQTMLSTAAFVVAVVRHLREQLERDSLVPGNKVLETFMGIDRSWAEPSSHARQAPKKGRFPSRLFASTGRKVMNIF